MWLTGRPLRTATLLLSLCLLALMVSGCVAVYSQKPVGASGQPSGDARLLGEWDVESESQRVDAPPDWHLPGGVRHYRVIVTRGEAGKLTAVCVGWDNWLRMTDFFESPSVGAVELIPGRIGEWGLLNARVLWKAKDQDSPELAKENYRPLLYRFESDGRVSVFGVDPRAVEAAVAGGRLTAEQSTGGNTRITSNAETLDQYFAEALPTLFTIPVATFTPVTRPPRESAAAWETMETAPAWLNRAALGKMAVFAGRTPPEAVLVPRVGLVGPQGMVSERRASTIKEGVSKVVRDARLARAVKQKILLHAPDVLTHPVLDAGAGTAGKPPSPNYQKLAHAGVDTVLELGRGGVFLDLCAAAAPCARPLPVSGAPPSAEDPSLNITTDLWIRIVRVSDRRVLLALELEERPDELPDPPVARYSEWLANDARQLRLFTNDRAADQWADSILEVLCEIEKSTGQDTQGEQGRCRRK